MPATVTDRREKFRAYMRGFNPTRSPRDDIKRGWIVDNPTHSAYITLAARADLQPGSQQLIAGGIGSGKTTELLLAERWLLERGHTVPIYIDVTRETDLSGINSGALLACLGLDLRRRTREVSSPAVEKARKEIDVFVHGKWVSEDEADLEWPDLDGWIKVGGRLERPIPPLSREIAQAIDPLRTLLDAARVSDQEFVLILDGLDRLMDPARFWTLVGEDFRALRKLGLSVLAAAPLSVLFGFGRQAADHFDQVRHLPPATVDPDGSPFLRQILERRGAGELVQHRDMDRLCQASGGVLRDLLSLARSAGEIAYIAGREKIDPSDVGAAIEQLGRSYELGLGTQQVKRLAMIRLSGFSIDEDQDLELLLTRRVLEYEGPPPRYKVHPALAAVL
jgi:hypothetical protein